MSQNEAILNYLWKGKPLTALTALRQFGCLRLAARIHDLRKGGYTIEQHLLEMKDKHVAEYRLVRS